MISQIALIFIVFLILLSTILIFINKKQTKEDFKLPTQVAANVPAQFNENGKKFSTLKPATQEKKVYEILNDQTFIDTMIKPRRLFDVNNKKDIEVYKKFLENEAWGGECCPFALEEPYISIPDMIKDKLIYHFLKVKRSA